MSRNRIMLVGDPVLRQVAKPVTVFHSKLGKLLDDMARLMYAAENGGGLAANQAGELKRVVVIDLGDDLREFINPEVLDASGEQTGPESCLSVPGYYGIVTRAKHVNVRFMDRQGNENIIEADDLLARCIQHEIDHLDGILYIDRVRPGDLYHSKTHTVADLDALLRRSRGEG